MCVCVCVCERAGRKAKMLRDTRACMCVYTYVCTSKDTMRMQWVRVAERERDEEEQTGEDGERGRSWYAVARPIILIITYIPCTEEGKRESFALSFLRLSFHLLSLSLPLWSFVLFFLLLPLFVHDRRITRGPVLSCVSRDSRLCRFVSPRYY